MKKKAKTLAKSSAKFSLVEEILQMSKNAGKRVIIVSQTQQLITLIAQFLNLKGV